MIPHDLQSVAFPKLDESQIASLSRCAAATRERYEAGRKLFQVGDRAYKFFVVQSGQVEIVDESVDAPKTIAIHGPGEFTGEMGQLTNEAQLCTGSEVVIVGGGNSAGQAAVFLAGHARKVHLVVRGPSLYDGMSSYLAPPDRTDAQHRGPPQHHGLADVRG